MQLLSLREHSRKELERKLAAYEETPGELAQALDFLRQELLAKGLPTEAVALAVDQLRSTELERGREVWRKKFGAPPADASERAKQVRFLLTRGFGAEVVRRLVSGADELV